MDDEFEFEIPDEMRAWFEQFEKKNRHWILVNGKIKEVDFLTWARWFENIDNRIVDRTDIGEDVFVSTVFLGLDHGLGREMCFEEGRKPVLFETMVMGGKYNSRGWRYSSYGEAKIGHWKIVDCIKVGEPPNVEFGERPFIELFLDMFKPEEEEDG